MPSTLTHLNSPGFQATRDLSGNPALLNAFNATWTQRLRTTIARPPRPLFYDPVATPTADDADTATVFWTAFPKRLHPTTPNPTMDDFRQGDEGPDDPNYSPSNSRGWQDEYCEWSVEKDAAGKITRVVFTCENPDYWDQLWRTDPETVVNLYQTFISEDVRREHLADASGRYLRENRWNDSVNHAMHLVSDPNNLFAEIRLAADATIVRKRDDGTLITDQDELIGCAGFGSAGRHSDPSIGAAVNSLARDERAGQITLQDPFGLYIDKGSLDRSIGFVLPAEAPVSAHPRDYWKILRGTDEFILRAEYSVPEDQGFTVGDIEIDGESIRFGGQIAEKMQIKLTAVYGDLQPVAPEAIVCNAPAVLGFLDEDLGVIPDLAAPPGASGGVVVLCTSNVASDATVAELDDKVTLTLGEEIPITSPDFKVYQARVVIRATATPGPIFLVVSNPDGLTGVATDPGLTVSAAPLPASGIAAAEAREEDAAMLSTRTAFRAAGAKPEAEMKNAHGQAIRSPVVSGLRRK